MADDRSFDDKFWHDKHGKFVVWQTPNWALIGWFICTVLHTVLPDSTIELWIGHLGKVFLIIWAVMEVTRGVNYFRRLLGLSVLLFALMMTWLT